MFSKTSLILLLALQAACMARANDAGIVTSQALTASELVNRVEQINRLQNQSMLKTTTVADVDALYQHYTDDFSYVHPVYGGTYSRQQLYQNHLNNLKAGRYQATTARYRIVSVIAGHNAVAIERQEVHQGVSSNHLSVFEFDGSKVSRIIEYWK